MRRYGYHKDAPDHRDYGVGSVQLAPAVSGRLDNLAFMGPVLDQGQQGSCTAHAAVADREFLHWKQLAFRGELVTPTTEGLYSPAYLYYLERQIDGTLAQGDTGSYGRTSCQALNRFGCALRADMPYHDTDFTTAPTSEQLAAAHPWAAGGYHRLATVDDMRSVIATGYNFRIGFTVYESFEHVGHDGKWSPSKHEQVMGGHEVLGIGYSDDVNGGSFLVRNSWGKDWGYNGNFWLRYSDAADHNILSDAWIQHLGSWK